ncbi:MAG: inorganic diphosphatase [Methylococcales bacterium]|nr:inorganic diphosphatase [Methylococcales bacterium]
MTDKKDNNSYMSLNAFDPDSSELNIIIETPKGCRNKFKYDERSCLFKLSGVLPLGAVFPFDFGYIPTTLGDDGDPLDVLIFMDEPAFPGCLVPGRLIGVIEANQTEDEQTNRNDRLIAVAADSRNHSNVHALSDLNSNLIDEIEHFFISYNQMKGKKFEVLGRFGPDHARCIVDKGSKKFCMSSSHKKAKKMD